MSKLRPEEILEAYFLFMGCADESMLPFNGAMIGDWSACKTDPINLPVDVEARYINAAGRAFALFGDRGLYLTRLEAVPSERMSPHDTQCFPQCVHFWKWHEAEVQPDGSVIKSVMLLGANAKWQMTPMPSTQKAFLDSLVWQYRSESNKRKCEIAAKAWNAHSAKTLKYLDRAIKALLYAQFSWTCAVTMEGIRFVLPTDPTGVRQLWKLRDIPAGAKRRAALLHWVSDHWRQARIDPDMEGYVRKHLRGQNECTQGGMKIEIIPSQVDLQASEQAASERVDMRKFRRDRRKRLAKVMANG